MKLLLLLITVIINVNYIKANNVPYQFKGVGIDNSINAVIDNSITLTDEFDNEINLIDIINSQPTIINFVYLNCPLLCHLLLDGIVDVIKRSNYVVGSDYQIISISIDPKESNNNLQDHKKKYLNLINKQNGWMFLKGTKENIEKLTNLFGYKYKYIKRTNDYAHPSALFFYNNKLNNYIEGVTFDSNLYDYSIISTKSDTTLKEKIITYCYYFDPDSQTYSLYIFRILRIACLITVVILSIMIINIIRKERSNSHGHK